MDRRLIRAIENDYPYPIASELRIINTEDYLELNGDRLKQLLKTIETSVHFFAIVAVVDLIDNFKQNPFEIPGFYKKEFPFRFTRTSFGKWIALLRDTIKVFKKINRPMFIKELPEFFFPKEYIEGPALKAFNRATTIRNKIAHFETVPTKKDIQNLCIEIEEQLEIILQEMNFITKYPLLFVNNVMVQFPKWHIPLYNHSFSEIIGNTSKFYAYKKVLNKLVNTPAVILIKEKEEEYMNLDPLIIFSDEGEKHIPDVFLYIDWDRKLKIKYRPVWNGGEFSLHDTAFREQRTYSFLSFFEAFALKEDFLKLKQKLG